MAQRLLLPLDQLIIPRDELGELDFFDQGGEGTLYRVPSWVGPFGLPVLFKEYRPERRTELDAEALSRVAGFVRQLDEKTRYWLYRCTSWPSWVVHDGDGAPAGVLIPEAPRAFRASLRKVSGGTRQVPSRFELLLNGDEFLASVGVAVSPRQKLELAISVAETTAFLHAHSMIVGDFSCKNLLFSLQPSPRSYFIDCDSFLWSGRSALPAGETPEWELRSGEHLGETSGDVYKFALLVLRLYTGAQHHRDPRRLPSSATPAIRSLLESSLQSIPAGRPLITEWLEPLRVASTQASPVSVTRHAPGAARPVLAGSRPDRQQTPAARSQIGASDPGVTLVGKYRPRRPVTASRGAPPSGRVWNSTAPFVRRLLVRKPISPTWIRMLFMLVGMWIGCGIVFGLALAAGMDLHHLGGGTEFLLFVAFVLLGALAFRLATSEPA